MKRLWLSILVLTAAFLPGILYAKWEGITTRANVPFEFAVGDKTIPAGHVEAELTSALGGALWVGNRDLSTGTYIIMQRTSVERSKPTTIVFHRYGSHYFLASVARHGSTTAFRAPESRLEAALRTQTVPEVVTVAAK
ncbi:MAG TPA: hypothetical protein VHR84_04975 [Terriglobales bacterium]|jgi:hypothetical protein|nr:hypothetical protein [Terriglobales bacterium]